MNQYIVDALQQLKAVYRQKLRDLKKQEAV